MSKAAMIVSRSILGAYYEPVRLGFMTFRIYQPTIKTMCRVFSYGDMNLRGDVRRIDVIFAISRQTPVLLHMLSAAIFPKCRLLRFLLCFYLRKFATSLQLLRAFEVVGSITRGDALFENVKFDEIRSDDSFDTAGNNTLSGVIATLKDALGLSYAEVTEKISYPVLLLMSADKMRSVYGNSEKMMEVSEDEFFKNKKGKL